MDPWKLAAARRSAAAIARPVVLKPVPPNAELLDAATDLLHQIAPRLRSVGPLQSHRTGFDTTAGFELLAGIFAIPFVELCLPFQSHLANYLAAQLPALDHRALELGQPQATCRLQLQTKGCNKPGDLASVPS
jgi:hypothetical protein